MRSVRIKFVIGGKLKFKIGDLEGVYTVKGFNKSRVGRMFCYLVSLEEVQDGMYISVDGSYVYEECPTYLDIAFDLDEKWVIEEPGFCQHSWIDTGFHWTYCKVCEATGRRVMGTVQVEKGI